MPLTWHMHIFLDTNISLHKNLKNVIIESRLGQKMSYIGVYPYRELSLKKTLSTILMFFHRAIFSKDKIYDIILGIFLSHTRLLEDLLFYLWYFAPKFFFYSRLFRNRLLGLEMMFDSGYLIRKASSNEKPMQVGLP